MFEEFTDSIGRKIPQFGNLSYREMALFKARQRRFDRAVQIGSVATQECTPFNAMLRIESNPNEAAPAHSPLPACCSVRNRQTFPYESTLNVSVIQVSFTSFRPA